jgi:hypothetical protein
MPSIRDMYWHELRIRFRRLPVWLPGTSMSLGDVGVLTDAGWTKVTSLAELGVPFTTGQPGTPSSVTYSSHDGAEVSGSALAGGLGLPPGTAAELSLRFGRAGAFVLIADDLVVSSIDGLAGVDAAVLRSFQQGEWQSGWTYVSEVAVAAKSVTAVGGGAQASATVRVGTAGADAGLRFTYMKDLAASFATAEPATVMWRGRYVQDLLLRRARMGERGITTRSAEPVVEADEFASVCDVEYPSDIADGT